METRCFFLEFPDRPPTIAPAVPAMTPPTNAPPKVLAVDFDIFVLPFSINSTLKILENGIIQLLDAYDIELAGKNAVVIGRSNIVGKPMALLLLNRNATVTICHSRTKNLSEITKTADILVVAIGKPKFITADMVKKDAVVIDVGTNRVEEKLCGDVDFEEVSKIASYISPVPGGVGPLTIASLLENTVKAYKKILNIEK